MKAIKAEWTPRVNILTILCDCGKIFKVRLDRWRVVCPRCGERESIVTLRNEFVRKEVSSGDLS